MAHNDARHLYSMEPKNRGQHDGNRCISGVRLFGVPLLGMARTRKPLHKMLEHILGSLRAEEKFQSSITRGPEDC